MDMGRTWIGYVYGYGYAHAHSAGSMLSCHRNTQDPTQQLCLQQHPHTSPILSQQHAHWLQRTLHMHALLVHCAALAHKSCAGNQPPKHVQHISTQHVMTTAVLKHTCCVLVTLRNEHIHATSTSTNCLVLLQCKVLTQGMKAALLALAILQHQHLCCCQCLMHAYAQGFRPAISTTMTQVCTHVSCMYRCVCLTAYKC